MVEPALRAPTFSVLMAAMALAFVVAAAIGGALSASAAATACVVSVLAVGAATVAFVPGAAHKDVSLAAAGLPCRAARACTALACVHMLRVIAALVFGEAGRTLHRASCAHAETLPAHKRGSPAVDTAQGGADAENPALAKRPPAALQDLRAALAVLVRSRLFMQLAAIMALTGMAMESLQARRPPVALQSACSCRARCVVSGHARSRFACLAQVANPLASMM